MIYEKKQGVPKFECHEYFKRIKDYVVLIPVINEGDRILKEQVGIKNPTCFIWRRNEGKTCTCIR